MHVKPTNLTRTISPENDESSAFENLVSMVNSLEILETNAEAQSVNIPTKTKDEIFLPEISSNHEHIEYLLLNKDENLKKQELDALSLFVSALSPNIPIQNKLLSLSSKQLSILLPYTYVESSHKLNPVIAYNTPDTSSFCNTSMDDNVAMIKAYSVFLFDLNLILNGSENIKTKRVLLAASIKKVFGILLYGNEKNTGYMVDDNITSFTIPINTVYNNYLLGKKIRSDMAEFNNKNIFPGNIPIKKEMMCNHYIETFKTKISLYFINAFYLRVCSFTTSTQKNDIIDLLAAELLVSYECKDLLNIFKVTSDFMYTHILPNANGRASQIFKDCFALMLNESPFGSLTCMSHYMYLDSTPEKNHLEFMQAIFIKRLDAIKENDFAILIEENQINTLIAECEENGPLKVDIDNYRKLIKGNALFKQYDLTAVQRMEIKHSAPCEPHRTCCIS